MQLPKWIDNPTTFRKVNGWATIVWFFAAFPICIFFANSVPFLVFISVYAVVTGHLATWQSARVEERQEKDDNVADVSHKVDKLREGK